jgi:hypothetical protein
MFSWCSKAALLGLISATAVKAQNIDPRPPGSPPLAPPPTVDVVLCLDTSNSMDGLILSAKAKLWDIVNDLARIRPTPVLRVGLYSYGNDNYPASNGWIRKELDLCSDLDEVYRKLNALTTRGGNEFATRVARDALIQQPWATNSQAMKLLFVCGNEPADQDRETSMLEIAAAAKRLGVTINCIFCGRPRQADANSWRQFAAYAGGAFLSIDTTRPVYVPKTPYDDEINKWGVKLNATYLPYGTAETRTGKVANQVAQDANASQLGAGVAAGRAIVKAGAQYRNAEWDLCDRKLNDKNFDVTKVPEEQLPESLRQLPPGARAAAVDKMIAERQTIQKEIESLSRKRSEYIAAEQKKTPAPSKSGGGLDDAFRTVLRQQAADRGLKMEQ